MVKGGAGEPKISLYVILSLAVTLLVPVVGWLAYQTYAHHREIGEIRQFDRDVLKMK